VVAVNSGAFSPADISIVKGTTVRWNWDTCTSTGGDPYGGGGQQTCVAHNVTFDGFSSTTQSTGSWAHTFDQAGTFAYQCTVHGAAMSGRVVVQ
jgi:plastocyanin